MNISFDHDGKDDTVPLPATLIHDISSLLEKDKDSSRLRLFSDFPFPNRRDRSLDTFETAAIAALRANPDEPFVMREKLDGVEAVVTIPSWINSKR